MTDEQLLKLVGDLQQAFESKLPKLFHCPNCSAVYSSGDASCTSRQCQESETWIPPRLEVM